MIEFGHDQLAVIGIIIPIIISIVMMGGFIIILRQIRFLHTQINSRMDEYIIVMSKLVRAEGDATGYARRTAEEKELKL